jgi:hypothetical protein
VARRAWPKLTTARTTGKDLKHFSALGGYESPWSGRSGCVPSSSTRWSIRTRTAGSFISTKFIPSATWWGTFAAPPRTWCRAGAVLGAAAGSALGKEPGPALAGAGIGLLLALASRGDAS